MKFEKIKLNQLKPAPYNPRVIKEQELKKLSNNLEEFGLVDPIIIDLSDNNTIIGGHQRFKVLENKHLPDDNLNLIKLGDIGWVFEDTELRIKDKNHQKALNVSLNKIQGEWDFTKLEDLVLDFKEDDYLIELTGFDKDYFNFDIDFSEQPLDSIPNLSQFESKEEVTLETEENSSTNEQNIDETNNVTEPSTEYIMLKINKKCLSEIKNLISEKKYDTLLSDVKYGIEIIE